MSTDDEKLVELIEAQQRKSKENNILREAAKILYKRGNVTTIKFAKGAKVTLTVNFHT